MGDLDGTVAFLLGPDGRAFTGVPVTLDQGWTAREYTGPPIPCIGARTRVLSPPGPGAP